MFGTSFMNIQRLYFGWPSVTQMQKSTPGLPTTGHESSQPVTAGGFGSSLNPQLYCFVLTCVEVQRHLLDSGKHLSPDKSYGSFNDQMWQQAISSLRNIDETHRKCSMYDDESVLFELIERGMVDLSPSDNVAIGSIIRYMAVVGERLWSMLESQQAMINQVERQFYRAMSDNRVLSDKIVRLEAWLNKMEEVNSPVIGTGHHDSSTTQLDSLVGGLIRPVGPASESSSVPLREFVIDPCILPSGQLSENTSPLEDPITHRSAWVGLFVDVPLSSLEGRKCRQRERFQRHKEIQAAWHLEDAPPVINPLDDKSVPIQAWWLKRKRIGSGAMIEVEEDYDDGWITDRSIVGHKWLAEVVSVSVLQHNLFLLHWTV
ncbi:hypothetical protein BDM02DRAFT_3132804 [Thelephora ganbajun]|uniref:Uncharacterized protein n=1 Tax=Thelephora ganbajun TaxID=370292 RepID=A0ACB6Z083_THEGA|nr:hypothetical protein BDM02DRAFT_3132804 [Thelephora ganbajun]